MNKIEYGFTAVPNNFTLLFDNSTFKLITFFIYKHNYFNSANKLDKDGYFYISSDEISRVLGINKKDVCLVNDALYNAELIYIKSNGFEVGKRHTNKYKLNTQKVKELAKILLIDILEGRTNVYITKSKRGTKCSYVNKSINNEYELSDNSVRGQNATNNGTECNQNEVVLDANSNPTKDNIYNIIDINVIENETAINNNTDESIDDYYKRMFEEEKEIIDEMNKTFDSSNGEDYDNNNINKNNSIIDGLPLQAWITKIFNAIDEYNDKFFSCRTVEDAKYYYIKLDELFEIVQQYNNVFSDAQWEVIQTKADRYIKIHEQKEKYFNAKHYHQPSAEQKTTSIHVVKQNNSAPTPPTADEMHEQMMADFLSRF